MRPRTFLIGVIVLLTIPAFLDDAFDSYFAAWDHHRKGTGELLIPIGPRKL